MDVVRLHNLADLVISDYETTGILKHLKALETAFAASVTSPTPETAQGYETAKTEFLEATAGMATRQLTASQLVELERLYAADLVGNGLIKRAEEILTFGVSPATIVANLQELRARMQKFRQSLETLLTGLTELGLSREESEPAEADAEISLPGKLFDNSLGGFAKESKQLNDALLALVEVATGSRPPLRIRAMSTASIDILIQIDMQSAKVLLEATAAILGIIGGMLAIRQHYRELQKQEMPAPLREQMETWHR